MSEVPGITDNEFEKEVMQSDLPVLVDFWAPWCGPCRAMAPVIDEISASYDGKIKVRKMNVEENKKTPVQYRIRSIPTLILFKGGKVMDQIIGNVGKEKIEETLKKVL